MKQGVIKIKNLSGQDISSFEDLMKDFVNHAQQTFGFSKPVEIQFVSDPSNAPDPLGKTAYYEPGTATVVVYIDDRHPKDIMRSVSHELVHHTQNERGDFDNVTAMGEGYAQSDDHLREMEREAYEAGNLCFRDWEDNLKTNKKKQTIYVKLVTEGFAGMQKTNKRLKLESMLRSRIGRLFESKEALNEYGGRPYDPTIPGDFDRARSNPTGDAPHPMTGKQAWMAAFSHAAGNPQPRPQDFWDTATHLYSKGEDPVEAGKRYAGNNMNEYGDHETQASGGLVASGYSSEPSMDFVEDIALGVVEGGGSLMQIATALQDQGFDVDLSSGALMIQGTEREKFFIGKAANFDIDPSEETRQIGPYVLGFMGSSMNEDYDDYMGELEDEFPWLAKSVKANEIPAEVAAQLAKEYGSEEEEPEEPTVMKEAQWGGFTGGAAPMDPDQREMPDMSYEEQLRIFSMIVDRGDIDPKELLFHPENIQNNLSFPDLTEDDVEDILEKLGLPEMSDPSWHQQIVGRSAVQENQMNEYRKDYGKVDTGNPLEDKKKEFNAKWTYYNEEWRHMDPDEEEWWNWTLDNLSKEIKALEGGEDKHAHLRHGELQEVSRRAMLEAVVRKTLVGENIDPGQFPNPLPQNQRGEDFLSKGLKDGSKSDDMVKASPASLPAASAKPSQSAIYLGKALGMAVGGIKGGELNALISQDNYILDGHHRWAATMFSDPSASISGMGIGMPMAQLIPVLRAVGDAYGNSRRGEPAGGDVNIFKATLEDAKAALKQIDGGNKFVQAGGATKWLEGIGGDKELAKRLEAIKAKGGAAASAPPRAEMPVIDADKGEDKDVATRLNKGAIDVNPPYAKADQDNKKKGGAIPMGMKENRNKDTRKKRVHNERYGLLMERMLGITNLQPLQTAEQGLSVDSVSNKFNNWLFEEEEIENEAQADAYDPEESFLSAQEAERETEGAEDDPNYSDSEIEALTKRPDDLKDK